MCKRTVCFRCGGKFPNIPFACYDCQNIYSVYFSRFNAKKTLPDLYPNPGKLVETLPITLNDKSVSCSECIKAKKEERLCIYHDDEYQIERRKK